MMHAQPGNMEVPLLTGPRKPGLRACAASAIRCPNMLSEQLKYKSRARLLLLAVMDAEHVVDSAVVRAGDAGGDHVQVQAVERPSQPQQQVVLVGARDGHHLSRSQRQKVRDAESCKTHAAGLLPSPVILTDAGAIRQFACQQMGCHWLASCCVGTLPVMGVLEARAG